MFWILFACTVGTSDPSTPGSKSAIEAEKLHQYAEKAGALSNAARELEEASSAARNRIVHGADPATEVEKIENLILKIERLESELQAENAAMINRIGPSQSTPETRK